MTAKGFSDATELAVPHWPGSKSWDAWTSGAFNGRANRQPPTERSTPAYYEGWQWGRNWVEAENVAGVNLTDEQFYRLCEANPTMPLERSASGALVINSPVGGEGGRREADLIADLTLWNRQTKLGKVFSSSTMFKLPGGGDRSPDAAWVELSRWQRLTPEERAGFPPICPDFVAELRSEVEVSPLQDKMQEYLASGLRLGWLIDPQAQTVEIYRPSFAVEKVQFPALLSGESVLPGFALMWPSD